MKDINLLPEEIQASSPYSNNKVAREGIPIKGIIITVFVLLLFGATLLIPTAYIKVRQMQLDSLEADVKSDRYKEVKSVNAQIASVETNLKSKVEVINYIDDTNISVNELVVAIRGSAPTGCDIHTISVAKGVIELSGKIQETMGIAQFVSNLDRLSGLQRKGQVKVNEDFTFTLSLNILEKGAN